jgi:hypothetical protein
MHARHKETEAQPRFDTKGEAEVRHGIPPSSKSSIIEKIHQIIEKINECKLPK